MGHAEFLKTQAAHKISHAKRMKKHRKAARNKSALGKLDLFCCGFCTVFAFMAHWVAGLVVFLFVFLPCYFEETRQVVWPLSSIKGDPDCPKCHGKYFMQHGIMTYWLGWTECDCNATRILRKGN